MDFLSDYGIVAVVFLGVARLTCISFIYRNNDSGIFIAYCKWLCIADEESFDGESA